MTLKKLFSFFPLQECNFRKNYKLQIQYYRFLEVPAEHRSSSNDFETTVWIADPDVEFRRATILEEHDDNITVGYRDENGHFEKVDNNLVDYPINALFFLKLSNKKNGI